jgi:SAM-dependent methyltransferase
MIDPISKRLRTHYDQTFGLHGPTSLGVDWGIDKGRLELRYDRMLDLVRDEKENNWSLLDVGCGYGGLLEHARSKSISPIYYGLDVSESMIAWGLEKFPEATFLCRDVLSMPDESEFDYVICNGILTQKLDTPGLEMDAYANRLIRKLFSIAKKGAAFNVMTTKVNFFSNNLYYRNPIEMLGWCMSDITRHVRIDHSYPLFEYTVYLYKSPT